MNMGLCPVMVSDAPGRRISDETLLMIVMSLVVKRASGADQDVNNIYELIDFDREFHE